MESKPISEAIAFSEDKMRKNSLFDSPHLFYDVYCLLPGQHQNVQGGRLGVDFAVQNNLLRNQTQLSYAAARNVQNRNVIEVGGVWIDDGFDTKMPTLTVKAQSDAYFRLLEKQPQLKDVFRLGNHLVWVTPSGTALVVDTSDGKDELADKEIDKLFTAKK